jgi:hypothetical protein
VAAAEATATAASAAAGPGIDCLHGSKQHYERCRTRNEQLVHEFLLARTACLNRK